ncbi:diguanylate cyclase domain-containing protein [Legionella donaldsonii]|uniref:diguanylate cyclase domain-containing protein n=1 Tax=Legionella donaldsonii TaxID=45060 RepID=UPI00399CC79D
MSLVSKLKAFARELSTSNSDWGRQYRLINNISIELIILGLFLLYINFVWHMWMMVHLVIAACGFAALNLFILKKTKNTVLCGHFLTLLALIITTLGNYWMGGLSSSYFVWYYVIPILAAVTISWYGLVLYAALCLAMVVFFSMQELTPIYQLAPSNVLLMNFINISFSLFVIATTLYGVLRENEQYEKLLSENNYLLQTDKEKFHYLARYDALTNLPNRTYFQMYIQNMLEAALNKNYCITFFFMDLDKFKHVNDVYGHEAGDSLLSQSAKRLQSCFREKDFLARLGGDEFIALIMHQNGDKIPQTIAKRILQQFNKPFTLGAHDVICQISIGLAVYPFDAFNADELLAKADEAMYSAKKTGGNNYHFTKRVKRIYS